MDFQEIDKERAARGLSYAAIGAVLGVPGSTVRSWVRGERGAPDGMREAIAAALDTATPRRPWGVPDLPPEERARLQAEADAARRELGHEMRRLRKIAGLTPAEAAERCGLSRARIIHIESTGRASPEAYKRIRRALLGMP